MGIFDVIAALCIGGMGGLSVWCMVNLMDCFVGMSTGEDVRLEDIPPTRPQTWDMTEVMAATYRDEADKVYQQ